MGVLLSSLGEAAAAGGTGRVWFESLASEQNANMTSNLSNA